MLAIIASASLMAEDLGHKPQVTRWHKIGRLYITTCAACQKTLWVAHSGSKDYRPGGQALREPCESFGGKAA